MFEKDNIDNTVVKESYDFITNTQQFFKNDNSKIAQTISSIRDLQDRVVDASFYFVRQGDKVNKILNITDVDDKTIKNSIQQGMSLQKYTKKYTDAFFDDLEELNIEKAKYYPKATDHIKEMVVIIMKLMKKDLAYKGEDGCI